MTAPAPVVDTTGFIGVSPSCPSYFALESGAAFVPIGLNLAFPRIAWGRDEGLALYESYFGNLSRNGGNYARVWLSHPFLHVETGTPGHFDGEKAERLDLLLDSARRHGIRLQLCLDHFRKLEGEAPLFPGAADMGRPGYHAGRGGPFPSLDAFFDSAEGDAFFCSRLDFFAERYRDERQVFAWELWNEVDAVDSPHWAAWTRRMLPEVRRRFPRHLVTQSLGSHEHAVARKNYEELGGWAGNDFIQAHRYLNTATELEVCHGPIDLLSADVVEELLRLERNKPVLLNEGGAVEPHHAGPWKGYAKDRDGIVLHDVLFAPFFAGAAGPGHCWHWHEYVAPNDLWHHFDRFAQAVAGIDPIREGFAAFRDSQGPLRFYVLRGGETTLIWIRDAQNDWESEFVRGEAPPVRRGMRLRIDGRVPAWREAEIFDPWKNEWSSAFQSEEAVALPEFSRSLVVRLRHG